MPTPKRCTASLSIITPIAHQPVERSLPGSIVSFQSQPKRETLTGRRILKPKLQRFFLIAIRIHAMPIGGM